MTDLIGPLSEGRTLLALAVLAGVVLAAIGRYLLLLAGLPVPDTAVLAVGGIVAGLGLVFLGHVAWYADG